MQALEDGGAVKCCLLDVALHAWAHLPQHKTCMRSSQPDHQHSIDWIEWIKKTERTWRGDTHGYLRSGEDLEVHMIKVHCLPVWIVQEQIKDMLLKREKDPGSLLLTMQRQKRTSSKARSRFSSDTHLPALWFWACALPERRVGSSVPLKPPDPGVLCQQPQWAEVAGVWH